MKSTFDIRLKELRKGKGITQEQLAKDLGVNNTTISIWERGVRKPDINTIEQLAVYFGVSTGYLLGDDVGRGTIDDTTASVVKREPDYSSEDLEQIEATVRKYVQLSDASRAIVAATIDKAYRIDKEQGCLNRNMKQVRLVMDE